MTQRKYRDGYSYGMSTGRIPTAVYLDRVVIEALDDLATTTGRKRADLLREAVQRLLVAYANP